MTSVRAEVITGVQRRRRCTRLQKERIVAAALEPGVVASQIARRAGIHSSQLLRWRKQLYQPAGPTLMPVTITPEPVIPAAPATPP